METITQARKVIQVLPAGTISGGKPTTETPATKIVNGTKYKAREANRIYSKANKTSDFIDYDKAMLKGRELLWNDKQMVIGFYIIFSINTGLRVSDVLNIKHSFLKDLTPGDYLNVTEKKTKKIRKIQINDKILDAYLYLSKKLTEQRKYNSEGFVFTSQKNMVFATISLNRILKQIFAGYAENISTHSLRKSFGRRVYDSHQQSEHSLIVLSEMFNHTSMAITRRYLGIRQEEIDNVYLSL